MRVVLLVTDHERGGTPLRLARLARGLHAAGVEVHAGCLAPPGPVTVELAAAGIATFACDARGARDILALRRLSQHVRRIRPDLIHATLLHANVAARLVGLLQRLPIIGSTATIEVERRWHQRLERATARIDRAHIVNSHVAAEHVIEAFRLPRDRVHVVPPSLDPWPVRIERGAARAALHIPEHDFVVAWAGRFDPVKRLDLIVRCAELLTAAPMRFVLVGDGPQRAHIEQMLRASPAGPRVQLLGWRSDVASILSAAGAFLFPSRTEGMPNAVLEAMALGLPIVASAIPVLRELSADGERFQVINSDAPEQYAQTLMALHNSPELRRSYGDRAAAWAREHLDPRATVAAVVQVYENVLAESPRRRP